jgi:hypothetical protein
MSTRPLTLPQILNDPVARAVASMLTPNRRTFTIRIREVIGVSPPRIPLSDLLAAASEKFRLVPHSWQRVAFVPTSVPHAGQSRGLADSRSPPPANPRSAFFHFSIRHCHR